MVPLLLGVDRAEPEKADSVSGNLSEAAADGLFGLVRALLLLRLLAAASGAFADGFSVFAGSVFYFCHVVPLLALIGRSLGVVGADSEKRSLLIFLMLGVAVSDAVVVWSYSLMGEALFTVCVLLCWSPLPVRAVRRTLEAKGLVPQLTGLGGWIQHLLVGLTALVRIAATAPSYLPALTAILAVSVGACFALDVIVDDLRASKEALRSQRDMFMNLVDVATDGFCCVSVSSVDGSQRLTYASEKLRQVLGIVDTSVDVRDVLASEEDEERFSSMVRSWEGSKAPWELTNQASCLVTCRALDPAEEFEVRLMPFRPPTGTLHVCFQLASERRTVLRHEDVSSLPADDGLPARFDRSLVDDEVWPQPRAGRVMRATRSSLAYSVSLCDSALGLGPAVADAGTQTDAAPSGALVCTRCSRPPPLPSRYSSSRSILRAGRKTGTATSLSTSGSTRVPSGPSNTSLLDHEHEEFVAKLGRTPRPVARATSFAGDSLLQGGEAAGKAAGAAAGEADGAEDADGEYLARRSRRRARTCPNAAALVCAASDGGDVHLWYPL